MTLPPRNEPSVESGIPGITSGPASSDLWPSLFSDARLLGRVANVGCSDTNVFEVAVLKNPHRATVRSKPADEDIRIKAFQRSEYGSPDVLELREIDIPTVADNEVLVRIRAASINMADVDYLRGHPKVARLGTGVRRPRNVGLGLDLAGVVESVGRDVTAFSAGDAVFGDLTAFGFGAFAEYACADEKAFALAPKGLTFAQAAAIPQAAVMALQGLGGKRSIEPGHKVLINGAGGNIGPFAVQIAKARGAEVTAVDKAMKLEMLTELGADHVIDFTRTDFTETDVTYDRILDMAPHGSLLSVRRVLSPSGVYITVPGTIASVAQALFLAPLLSLFGRKKIAMLPWKPFAPSDVAELKSLIASGKVTPVIDRAYPLIDVPEALRYQSEGATLGKVAITVP